MMPNSAVSQMIMFQLLMACEALDRRTIRCFWNIMIIMMNIWNGPVIYMKIQTLFVRRIAL